MVSNLPYFHVWLNINGGCGHIIEEPKEWPRWFGKVFECNQEVLASMLGIEDQVHLWRKPKDIDSRDVGPRVKRFLRVWKPFDWTILIEN